MAKLGKRGYVEVQEEGIRQSPKSSMDSVDIRYEKYQGSEEPELSIGMCAQDYLYSAVPLVDLLKFVIRDYPELLERAHLEIAEDNQRLTLQAELLRLHGMPNSDAVLNAPDTKSRVQDGNARLVIEDKEEVGLRELAGHIDYYARLVVPAAVELEAIAPLFLELYPERHNLPMTRHDVSTLPWRLQELVRQQIETAIQAAA